MDDLRAIMVVTLLAYMIEYLKVQFDFSILNVFVFINIIGLYYITTKIRISVRIDYNSD